MIAAEQKARTTYEHIMNLTDNEEYLAPLRFLREREIVHYQRFGEALHRTTDRLDSKNYYYYNPNFDKPKRPR